MNIKTQITFIALIPHHKSPFNASGATWVSSMILKVLPQEKYNPKTPIEIGVKEFVQWYRNYYGSNQW